MIFTHTIYCICACDFSVVNLVISLTSHQDVMMMWSVWPDHALSSICRLGGIKGSLHQMMEILRKNPFPTIFTGLSALRDVLEFGAASHQSGYQAGWEWEFGHLDVLKFPAFGLWWGPWLYWGSSIAGWMIEFSLDDFSENSKRLLTCLFQKQTFHLQSCLARKHWICHDVTLPSCASSSPTVAPDTVYSDTHWSKPLNTALCDNTRLADYTTLQMQQCMENIVVATRGDVSKSACTYLQLVIKLSTNIFEKFVWSWNNSWSCVRCTIILWLDIEIDCDLPLIPTIHVPHFRRFKYQIQKPSSWERRRPTSTSSSLATSTLASLPPLDIWSTRCARNF